MSDIDTSTPQTEPAEKPTGKPKRKRTRQRPIQRGQGKAFTQSQKPKPFKITPDLEKHSEAIFDGRWFWLGTLPTLEGLEGVDIGGTNFPKIMQRLSWGQNGKTKVQDVFGATVCLTKAKLEHMAARFQRTMVRWRTHGKEGKGQGENVGTPLPEGRRAKLITIPEPETVKAMHKQGRGVLPYQRRSDDEPVINHIYCVPCDGANERGLHRPPSLAETGLQWPED